MHCREQRREEREVGEGLEAPEDGGWTLLDGRGMSLRGRERK
jgi:hypothetical protein